MYFGAIYFGQYYPTTSASTAFVLTGETGTLQIVGQSAAIRYTRIATFDAGAMTIAGQDAGMFLGRRLISDAGALTVAGQSAGLLAGRRLTSSPGPITIAGQDALFLRGLRLPASAGALSIVGQDATLNYFASTYMLFANAGSLFVYGQDANFLTSRILTGASGALTLAGQDAVLTYSRGVIGALVLTQAQVDYMADAAWFFVSIMMRTTDTMGVGIAGFFGNSLEIQGEGVPDIDKILNFMVKWPRAIISIDAGRPACQAMKVIGRSDILALREAFYRRYGNAEHPNYYGELVNS